MRSSPLNSHEHLEEAQNFANLVCRRDWTDLTSVRDLAKALGPNLQHFEVMLGFVVRTDKVNYNCVEGVHGDIFLCVPPLQVYTQPKEPIKAFAFGDGALQPLPAVAKFAISNGAGLAILEPDLTRVKFAFTYGSLWSLCLTGALCDVPINDGLLHGDNQKCELTNGGCTLVCAKPSEELLIPGARQTLAKIFESVGLTAVRLTGIRVEDTERTSLGFILPPGDGDQEKLQAILPRLHWHLPDQLQPIVLTNVPPRLEPFSTLLSDTE